MFLFIFKFKLTFKINCPNREYNSINLCILMAQNTELYIWGHIHEMSQVSNLRFWSQIRFETPCSAETHKRSQAEIWPRLGLKSKTALGVI